MKKTNSVCANKLININVLVRVAFEERMIYSSQNLFVSLVIELVECIY